jgi:hypothetical protein
VTSAARLLAACALVAACAAGVACSDGDGNGAAGPGGGQGAPDPAIDCSALVTADEATALFGGAQATLDGGAEPATGALCAWEAEEPSTDGGLLPTTHLLQLQVHDGRAFYDPATWGDDPQPVDGVGDEAFVLGDGIGGGPVAGYRDGETVVFVSYSIVTGGRDATEARDDLVALLRGIADRLEPP